MRSHLPTRKNPLAAATSAAGVRDDVGDPTLYVTLNADYVTPGFVKPSDSRGAEPEAAADSAPPPELKGLRTNTV